MTSVARWIGKEKLKRRLRALPAAVKAQVRVALEKSATDLVAAQRRNAPALTGNLKRAIKWKWGSARGNRGALEPFTTTIHIAELPGVSKQPRTYAHLVEFGAAAHRAGGQFEGAEIPATPPQPYFYPTYRFKRKSIRSRIKRGVKKAIATTKG